MRNIEEIRKLTKAYNHIYGKSDESKKDIEIINILTNDLKDLQEHMKNIEMKIEEEMRNGKFKVEEVINRKKHNIFYANNSPIISRDTYETNIQQILYSYGLDVVKSSTCDYYTISWDKELDRKVEAIDIKNILQILNTAKEKLQMIETKVQKEIEKVDKYKKNNKNESYENEVKKIKETIFAIGHLNVDAANELSKALKEAGMNMKGIIELKEI